VWLLGDPVRREVYIDGQKKFDIEIPICDCPVVRGEKRSEFMATRVREYINSEAVGRPA
jgi:hypothetical protein